MARQKNPRNRYKKKHKARQRKERQQYANHDDHHHQHHHHHYNEHSYDDCDDEDERKYEMPQDSANFYQMSEKCKEMLFVWFNLSKDEKFFVLDLCAEEVYFELKKCNQFPTPGYVEAILSDAGSMSGIRLVFVEACLNGGTTQLPDGVDIRHPQVAAFFSLFEYHLHLIYVSKSIVPQLMLFLLLWTFTMPISTWFQLVLISLMCFFCYAEVWRFKEIRDKISPFLSACFMDTCPNRAQNRITAFCCAILTIHLAHWVDTYYIFVIIVALPFVLVEMEWMGDCSTNEHNLSKLRRIFVIISCCVTIYFVWYSWKVLLFSLFLFLPNIFVLIIYAVLCCIHAFFHVMEYIHGGHDGYEMDTSDQIAKDFLKMCVVGSTLLFGYFIFWDYYSMWGLIFHIGLYCWIFSASLARTLSEVNTVVYEMPSKLCRPPLVSMALYLAAQLIFAICMKTYGWIKNFIISKYNRR